METITEADCRIIKGKKFLRVTRLMDAVGISDFGNIPAKDRQFYLDRGAARHDLWEKVELGVDHEYTFDDRVEKYRAGHARFLRETGFRALPGGIEVMVYAPWSKFGITRKHPEFDGISGAIDRLGTIQSRVILADYKGIDIPDSTRIQTALYLEMLSPGYSFGSVERYGVGFDDKGNYKMSQKYKYADRDEAIAAVQKYFKETL